jgi:hypothetical protein
VPKHGVRCRSCTSQPAIPDVVPRDGPELYNRGNRSSMTAFGAVLRGAGRGFCVIRSRVFREVQVTDFAIRCWRKRVLDADFFSAGDLYVVRRFEGRWRGLTRWFGR